MKTIILVLIIVGNYSSLFAQNANFILTGTSLKLTNSGGVKLVLDNANYENNASDSSLQGESELILTGSNQTTMGGLFANNFQKLQINKQENAVLLGHQLTVSQELSLVSGLIDIGPHSLNMGNSNLIGGSDDSYVQTSGTGVLKRNLTNGDQLFPVGNASYNPAVLTNTRTTNDTVTIRVIDNVTADGTGFGNTLSLPFVKRSWSVGTNKPSGENKVSMRLHWDEAHEVNGFNDSSSFIVRHDGVNWERLGGTLGNVMNKSTHTVHEISQFSTFSISSHAFLVSNVLPRLIKIYPNPFTTSFTIEIASKLAEKAKVSVYGINGQLLIESAFDLNIGINTVELNQLSQLAVGTYVFAVESNNQVISKRIIKLL